jgi:hypothetical protein
MKPFGIAALVLVTMLALLVSGKAQYICPSPCPWQVPIDDYAIVECGGVWTYCNLPNANYVTNLDYSWCVEAVVRICYCMFCCGYIDEWDHFYYIAYSSHVCQNP